MEIKLGATILKGAWKGIDYNRIATRHQPPAFSSTAAQISNSEATVCGLSAIPT